VKPSRVGVVKKQRPVNNSASQNSASEVHRGQGRAPSPATTLPPSRPPRGPQRSMRKRSGKIVNGPAVSSDREEESKDDEALPGVDQQPPHPALLPQGGKAGGGELKEDGLAAAAEKVDPELQAPEGLPLTPPPPSLPHATK
jgi:hypothetical protein